MLDIYICEDQPEQLAVLRKKIENAVLIEQLDMRMLMATENPEDIIEKAQVSSNSGIYFLDVDLGAGVMDGFSLAKKIREIEPRCFIVFITSHSEMSYMTYQYKLEAMDYIVKDDPEQMDARIKQCLMNAYEKHTGGAGVHKDVFHIQITDGKSVAVKYKDIICFETSGRPHHVVMRTAWRRLEFTGKLNDIEQELPDGFFRCHRSAIINIQNVESVDYGLGQIMMDDGSKIWLSMRKKSTLKQLLKTVN